MYSVNLRTISVSKIPIKEKRAEKGPVEMNSEFPFLVLPSISQFQFLSVLYHVD